MAGRTAENKKQKIGIIADWKMSEAVQAEICGLNEALEGSESKISWCIYRRKEQDIVERMKKETKADALVVLDAGILEEFGEQAENGTYEGAELYGVGYSLKTIALLDNGNIQGLAVPDGYEIGYKSVEEITKRIEHRSYKMQGYITEYQVLGKENFSMDEDLERFYIPMNKKKRRVAVLLSATIGSAVLVLSGCSGKSDQTEKTLRVGVITYTQDDPLSMD